MRYTSIVAASLLLLIGAGCAAPAVSPSATSTPDAGELAPTAPAVPSSKTLDLSGQGLTSLPSSALGRTDLQELDISGNRIGGALPSEIGKLKALRVLDASGNLMTGVPAEIGHLPELRFLDLSDNRLTGLPHELAELKKLETLDLRGNDVSAFDLDVIRKGLPGARILVDGE
ncbi:MAG TPA: leucine-rich repeat domain-containing protein [Patescibacteria group bacterium]|nr:leucine-rich repeat domain-containing protein [Patescibacteria group bacterium]